MPKISILRQKKTFSIPMLTLKITNKQIPFKLLQIVLKIKPLCNHLGNKTCKSAVIKIPPNIGFQKIRNSDNKERIKNQETIDEHGREGWEQITNYGRRNQVEGVFSRWKRILGGTLKAKNHKNQTGEVKIGVLILNETLKNNPRKARIAA